MSSVTRRRPAALGALGLLSVLLLGCGGAPEPAADDASVSTAPAGSRPTARPGAARDRQRTRTPRPAPSRPSAPKVDDSSLGDLADLAEQQSTRQRDRAATRGPVEGGDVSWPQCPVGLGIPEKRTLGLPAPLPSARYVVVGLTNGPGFVENPCLADQVAAVRRRGQGLAAYAVVSYPDQETLTREGADGPFEAATAAGALRNVGYAQARYGIASMRRTALATPAVWVDVEPVRFFEWSGDTAANAAVVEGAVKGYTDAGYRVGVYSTAYLWSSVVGGLRLGVPEWRAAGETSREEALARCGDDSSIQGGPAILAQWVEGSRDRDVTCPGASGDLGAWFFDSSAG